MQYKAILFDTRSIQKYIFSSNQLKTNIGASYLVEAVFEEILLPAVREILGADTLDDMSWKRPEDTDWSSMTAAARVGYIGGGKALLLFAEHVDDDILTAVIAAFTKKLLIHAPGLHTGAAIGTLELAADGRYIGAERLNPLFDRLKEGQNTVFPAVNVPYTGLTLACSETGETANAWVDGRFCSWEVAAKLHPTFPSGSGEADVQQALMDKLMTAFTPEEQEQFIGRYDFPVEFARLGQKTPKNDIAVVHIDGNNMGRKFQGCETLTAYIRRSRGIRHDTLAAFAALVKHIVEHIDRYKDSLDLRDEHGLCTLPVRPIVLGGDDMTFVCAGKAAVEFSAFLMQHLMEKNIASCAGITIMNTSYPFFRAYEMAEELCGAAKNEMRALERAAGHEVDSCWLDFAILHGEQPPTLEQFRAREYRGARGDLHFGPYRVDTDGAGAMGERHITALLAGVRGLRRLPRNKVKELRRVLAYGKHEQQQFMTQLGHLNLQLPDVPAWHAYAENLWEQERTPYMDAIELMDYVMDGEV